MAINSLWSCGFNFCGQIGDGTTTDRTTPVKIMEDVEIISAGDNHNLAVKKDGSLWTWGLNDNGQLGDGTTIDRHVPVRIFY